MKFSTDRQTGSRFKTRMRIGNTVGIALAAAMVFLLGAPVQAGTVIFDPNNATKAIGIANLDIAGTPHDVDFTPEVSALVPYGAFPSLFDFITPEAATVAVDAVNDALNAEGGVFSVGGVELEAGRVRYLVGYDSEREGDTERVLALTASTLNDGEAWSIGSPDVLAYDELRVWATFTVVPEPSSALLSASALVTLGAVARRRKAIT